MLTTAESARGISPRAAHRTVRDCLQSTRAIGMTDVLSPSQVRAFSDCEVRCHGLSKTMMAQNICHAAVLAGHSVLFRSAAALLEVRRGPKNYAFYYRDWNHNYPRRLCRHLFPVLDAWPALRGDVWLIGPSTGQRIHAADSAIHLTLGYFQSTGYPSPESRLGRTSRALNGLTTNFDGGPRRRLQPGVMEGNPT